MKNNYYFKKNICNIYIKQTIKSEFSSQILYGERFSIIYKIKNCVKIKTSQVLVEQETRPKHELAYYKWMSLSNDSDIIVNKDWVVCIADPLDSIVESYERRNSGRNESIDGRDDVAAGLNDARTGTPDSTGTLLNEQADFTKQD